MKKIVLALIAGLAVGAYTVSHAQTPKPAAKAEAAKAAAPKGPSADDKAMDKAVANYKRNKGGGGGMGSPASMGKPAPKK